MEGFPISSDGTVIRPPPGPPPRSPRTPGVAGYNERPEQPAKYVYEPSEISTSAVVCGNWIAQVRQIFAGVSSTSVVWWTSVEQASTAQYQRWLIADPLDRLLLDPSTVVAHYDISWWSLGRLV